MKNVLLIASRHVCLGHPVLQVDPSKKSKCKNINADRSNNRICNLGKWREEIQSGDEQEQLICMVDMEIQIFFFICF